MNDIKQIKYLLALVVFLLLAILFVLTFPTILEYFKGGEVERLLALFGEGVI